jgi:hypothetical protein
MLILECSQGCYRVTIRPCDLDLYLFSIIFLYIFIISSLFPYFNLFVSTFIQSYVNSNLKFGQNPLKDVDYRVFTRMLRKDGRTDGSVIISLRNLFSIIFLYIFIISSLFPYFNLFVSIFIQCYVNSNLHYNIQQLLVTLRSYGYGKEIFQYYLWSIV